MSWLHPLWPSTCFDELCSFFANMNSVSRSAHFNHTASVDCIAEELKSRSLSSIVEQGIEILETGFRERINHIHSPQYSCSDRSTVQAKPNAQISCVWSQSDLLLQSVSNMHRFPLSQCQYRELTSSIFVTSMNFSMASLANLAMISAWSSLAPAETETVSANCAGSIGPRYEQQRHSLGRPATQT